MKTRTDYTDYLGIDYGMGKSNIDHKTGIRYGVIHHGRVGQAWYDNSEADYGTLYCPHCGEDTGLTLESFEDSILCENCSRELHSDSFETEPLSFYYDKDGYKAFQSYDDPDIFIEKSPYFTYCRFCSPCAPGAGYLMNWVSAIAKHIDRCGQLLENNRAYCFDFSWFEGGKAPYPVYSVKTGKLVEA